MIRTHRQKIVSAIMALVMMISLIAVLSTTGSAEGATTYTLDATADLAAMAEGAKADGDTEKAGTDKFFTVYYSVKTKIDGSKKTFEDGYYATQRLAMGGKTSFTGTVKNAIGFSTDGPATVKIWWVCGDAGRVVQLANGEGAVIQSTADGCVKNTMYMDSFEITEAGNYYIGSTVGNNYYFRVDVITNAGADETPRADWSTVAAPEITEVKDEGDGDVVVTVKALVGHDGADEVVVAMYDANGNEIATKRSVAEKDEHTITFSPENSGTYHFVANLVREGETTKVSSSTSGAFVYPLGTPNIISATSKGNGKVELVFTEVHEATAYQIFVGSELKETVKKAQVMLEGFNVGSKVSITVKAVRGEEIGTASAAAAVTVTQDEQQTWGFVVYGPSTDTKSNGFVGSINEDDKVTVFSEGGKGKIQPNSQDGLAYYFTAVPSEYNFTLRATVTVDSWTISNGQEGFGLMAADRIGESGDGSDLWNNSYLVGATKFEYRYESTEDGDGIVYNDHTRIEYAAFPKYTMKLGLGVIERTGVNQGNLDLFQKNDTATIQNYFSTISKTFETVCGYYGMEKGTYNVIGNYTGNAPEGTQEARFLLTTFVLEIQKNNTGYFATYYDTNGNIIAQEKFYDPDALSQIDPENVYVGFFASRNARATFSDVKFTTILPENDAPAEERPIEEVMPGVSLTSPTVTTETEYVVKVNTNVAGTVKIEHNGKVIKEGAEVVAVEGMKDSYNYALPVTLVYGANNFIITFTPDPNQDLGEYRKLATTQNQSIDPSVQANKGYYHNKTIYVSPNGLPNGNGTKEYPFDIYSAVENVIPGQTIVIMEGTYLLTKTIKIQRDMDGTADAPIKMIADPEAKTRPVFDFQNTPGVAGIVHGGDYWYFYGFDVTRSGNMQKGFQVSGNYNVLDQIHTYLNGNSGVQICRYTGTDGPEDWPSYNLILNCTSYYNYDEGFEDADGFAAKLTIGPGNVFDGCIAYNNADDGWDLYAKVETGAISSVVIKNCVAYSNGYIPGFEKHGNGNGFKLGGSSLTGQHQLINCYAFYNLAKGIDSNSCPDIIVENCTSYNNGSYNCAFYTNVGDQTDFVAGGIISFKDADLVNHVPKDEDSISIGEQLKGKGTQASGKADEGKYINATTYYWNGSSCQSSKGTTLTASIFKSLEFTDSTITRNADGSINMNGFLELTASAPSDAGARMTGTASSDNSTLPAGDLHNYSEKWTTTDVQYHWHECDCGFRTDLGTHTYEYVIEVMPTPTTSGWKYKECTECGKRGSKIEMYYDELVDNNDNPGNLPGVDDGNHGEDNAPKLNFFQKIWKAIVDFFVMLFGGKKR